MQYLLLVGLHNAVWITQAIGVTGQQVLSMMHVHTQHTTHYTQTHTKITASLVYTQTHKHAASLVYMRAQCSIGTCS